MGEVAFDQFKELLNKANNISLAPRRQRNYFEVAGYPHYENVASSILAFFFDTNEEHGLKDLWLQSLMECYRRVIPTKGTMDLFDSGAYETVESGVIREDLTADSKRIDIVIPTNNDFVVAIENKIYATVDNPFDKYSDWIHKQYETYAHKVGIVLSLYKVDKSVKLDGIDSYGNHYDFVNITYNDLFSVIKDKVGSYLSSANEKWLIYMNEFIKSTESLQEVKMSINSDWQVFLEENNELIADYTKKMQNDQRAKVDLVKRFANSLQERFDNDPISVPTDAYIYGTQAFASHISLVVDLKKEDTTIALEPYFVKPGYGKEDYEHLGVFYVSLWLRNNKTRPQELIWLEEILNNNNIPYTKRPSSSWGDYLVVKEFDYSKSIDDQDVENYVFELWKVIAEAI